jgi:flagellin
LNTLTVYEAEAGLSRIKAAAQTVDSQRAQFGAYQNRMEHTYKNLGNAVENTQHAESVIRDTDMAQDMVRNSNLNILSQAGQSILAQANQTTQGVMSLLQ